MKRLVCGIFASALITSTINVSAPAIAADAITEKCKEQAKAAMCTPGKGGVMHCPGQGRGQLEAYVAQCVKNGGKMP
jgi:hypothetical protein